MNQIELTDEELSYVFRELRHAKRLLMNLMVRKQTGPNLVEIRMKTLSKIDRILNKLAGKAKA